MRSPHKEFVHRQVLAFFLENTQKLSRDDAKELITAIIQKKFPYIKIIY